MPKQFVTISRNLSIAIQIHKWSYGDCFIFLCHFIFRFSFHRSPHPRSGETEGSPAEDNTLSTTQHPRGSSPVQSSRLTSNNSLLGSLGHVPTCFPSFLFPRLLISILLMDLFWKIHWVPANVWDFAELQQSCYKHFKN